MPETTNTAVEGGVWVIKQPIENDYFFRRAVFLAAFFFGAALRFVAFLAALRTVFFATFFLATFFTAFLAVRFAVFFAALRTVFLAAFFFAGIVCDERLVIISFDRDALFSVKELCA